MPYYGFYGYDGYIIALIAITLIGLVAQASVNSSFKKFSNIRAASGVRACDAAREMLMRAGSSVTVEQVSGSLTDHFNPKKNTVGLSSVVYDSDSVAALAVAAHEIGHVMQHEEGYTPMKMRSIILPVANIGCRFAPWIVLLGVLLSTYPLAMAGVYLYAAMFAFQLITLPVELNASSRALTMLVEGGYITDDERPGAKKVLSAAASTYIVAALATLVTLLRLLAIAGRSRRR